MVSHERLPCIPGMAAETDRSEAAGGGDTLQQESWARLNFSLFEHKEPVAEY